MSEIKSKERRARQRKGREKDQQSEEQKDKQTYRCQPKNERRMKETKQR